MEHDFAEQEAALLAPYQMAWHEVQELRELFDRKTQCIFRKVQVEARSLAEKSERDKATLSRAVAAREFDLSKSRVDVLRWRQRSALLKVQLSSAEEDVRRYQRLGAILQRQYELEQESKLGAQRGAAAEAAAATERHWQQAAAWREELEAARAGLEDRQHRLSQLQRELRLSSERANALEQQLGDLQQQHAELERRAVAAASRAATLEQEAGQLRADNAQVAQQRAEWEKSAAQRLRQVEEAQARVGQLQQEVASKGAEVKALADQLLAEKRQKEDLKSQLAAEERQAAELQDQLALEKKQGAALMAQLKDSHAYIKELKEQAANRTVGTFVNQLESPGFSDLVLGDGLAANMKGQEQQLDAAGGSSHAAAAAAAAAALCASLASTEPLPLQHDEEATVAMKKKKPAAHGQQKRKTRLAQEGAGAVEEETRRGSGERENAPAAGGRPRRARGKAQLFWMGQQIDAEASEGQQQGLRQQSVDALDAAAHEQSATVAAVAEAEAEAADAAAAGTATDAVGDPAEEVGEEALGGKARRRGRRNVHAEQPSQGEGGGQAAEDAGPVAEAKVHKAKGRKAQELKRPQEIKTNLTSVWGGATPVPAASEGEVQQAAFGGKPSRKSNLAPKAASAQPQPAAAEQQEAAGSSQYHGGQAAAGENAREDHGSGPKASQGSAGASQPGVASRLHERPLGALNQRTLAAAANMASKPPGPLKSTLQKAIAARGPVPQQQPQKRKLLPSAASGFAGDVLPAEALFGGFKVPRLMK